MIRPGDILFQQAMEVAADWCLRLQQAPRDARLHEDLQVWLDAHPSHPEAWLLAQKAWSLGGEVLGEAEKGTAPARLPATAKAIGRRPLLAALAAVLVIVLCLPFLPSGWMAEYATGTDRQRRVALADGSAVTLGAGTAIDTAFTRDRREIRLLQGEAFFEVQHDSARPFVVQAGDMAVTVTGTAFDIGVTGRSYAVSVASGSVRVAYPSVGGSQAVILTPGQRVVIDRADGKMVRNSIDPAEIALWRSGRLVVRDAQFADVVDAIRRRHRGLVVIRDEALLGRRVTGVYELDDPLRALAALAGTYGAGIEEYTPFLTVVSRPSGHLPGRP